MDVQSEMGQGSCFTIFLPAHHTQVMERVPDQPICTGSQELILIVDDEQSILAVAKLMLETYNYRVIIANSGAEAITLFHQHYDEIDCVLMDVMMPEPNGLAVVAGIKRSRPELQCIAMSGLESKETIEEAKRLGFQDFLAKPFTTQDLLGVPARLSLDLVAITKATSLPSSGVMIAEASKGESNLFKEIAHPVPHPGNSPFNPHHP